MKRISVLGLGYIGLPTAIIAAENGYEVCGFDIDSEKVKNINSGEANILEPEIATRLQKVLNSNKFKAFDTLQEADCFIIAVPTPFKENKKADLTYVWRAGAILARVIKKNDLVILESTVPVGTSEKFASIIGVQSGYKPNVDFFTAHCPERVIPGKIFEELQKNDRVIGGVCQKASELAKEFYEKFVDGKLYLTNANTAEMVKLVENSSRDVQIAFAHELAAICEKANINTMEVIELANKHPRVNILQPTCGVGGHCIAVDPWFLIENYPSQTLLLKTARKINDERPSEVLNKINSLINQFKSHNLNKTPNLLLLGLTYKPDVNDIRESPALFIANELKNNKKINLIVCEPNIRTEEIASLNLEGSELTKSLKNADIVVFLVKHTLFKYINLAELDGKIVLDACGILYKTKLNQNDEIKFSKETFFESQI